VYQPDFCLGSQSATDRQVRLFFFNQNVAAVSEKPIRIVSFARLRQFMAENEPLHSTSKSEGFHDEQN
jgi:hypothetical protein